MAADIQSTTKPEPKTVPVRFTLPEWVASEVGLDNQSSLDDAVREAFLVNLYREDHLTHHQLSEALGLSRLETDGVLKRHRVSSGPTLDELRDEIGSLREARPE